MRILNDYIVIEKINESGLHLNRLQTEAFRKCKVIHANENSATEVGDILLIGEASFFDKADYFSNDYWFVYESQVFSIIRDGKIIPMVNIVYIKTDKGRKETVDIGGVEIYNDTSYNPMDKNNVVQDGIVHSVCNKAFNTYFLHPLEIEIVPGDKVYTHHFLTEESSEREFNGEKYYEIIYEELYCKINDGEIVMLNDWNFITPIKDTENQKFGIILTMEDKNIAQEGIIEVPNKNLGLSKGDKIFFRNNREYEIDVEGNTYYRIENEDILYNI